MVRALARSNPREEQDLLAADPGTHHSGGALQLPWIADPDLRTFRGFDDSPGTPA